MLKYKNLIMEKKFDEYDDHRNEYARRVDQKLNSKKLVCNLKIMDTMVKKDGESDESEAKQIPATRKSFRSNDKKVRYLKQFFVSNKLDFSHKNFQTF